MSEASVEVKELKLVAQNIEWGRVAGITFGVRKYSDRDGSEVYLPWFDDGGTEGDVKMDKEKSIRLAKAMIRLPYLAAVDVVFNWEKDVDLENIEVKKSPVIGINGPPHSGKTLILLTQSVLEDEARVTFSDFDPFSPESFTQVRDQLISRIEGWKDPETRTNLRLIMEEIFTIYRDNRKNGYPDSSGVTMRESLHNLTSKIIEEPDRKIWFLDLPGLDIRSKSFDVFNVLTLAMPTINVGGDGRELPFIEEGEWGGIVELLKVRREVFGYHDGEKTKIDEALGNYRAVDGLYKMLAKQIIDNK